MIHELALATNPQLMEKLAITVAQHQAGQARDVEKLLEMARARGIDIPRVEKVVGWDPKTQKHIKDMVPDIENLRMSKAGPGHSALIEKEIQKKHTGLTAGSKLRQKTLGKFKRFWGGTGGLGGKWRNRLALVGGLGALGLGIKSYMDANRLDHGGDVLHLG